MKRYSIQTITHWLSGHKWYCVTNKHLFIFNASEIKSYSEISNIWANIPYPHLLQAARVWLDGACVNFATIPLKKGPSELIWQIKNRSVGIWANLESLTNKSKTSGHGIMQPAQWIHHCNIHGPELIWHFGWYTI